MDAIDIGSAVGAAVSAANAYTDQEIGSIRALGPFTYVGSVATVDDLPTNLTASDKGKVYSVEENDGEYLWTGVKWIEFGIPGGGAVISVNGKVGEVELNAEDVDAYSISEVNDILKSYSKTIVLTDTEMTIADLKVIVDEINENGEHVLFDFSAFKNRMYACLVSIGERILINDLINGIFCEALYDGTMLVQDLIDGGKPYIVPNYELTVNCASSLGNDPLGTSIKVYKVEDDTEYLWGELTYQGSPLNFLVPLHARIKVMGVSNFPFVSPDTKYFDVDGDINTTINYIEVGGKSTNKDLQTLLDYGLEEEVLEIGDEINFMWTASNGTTYNLKPKVGSFENVIVHGKTTPEKAIIMQIPYGIPDSPQYDAPETEEATEENALADIYYYSKDGDTYALLELNEGDPIPYSEHEKIYRNSYRDPSCNIIRYGNSDLGDSAELQWLSSDKPRGEWYHATHVGDVAPSQANTVDGFQHGMSQEDLDCIGDIEFKIGTSTVTKDGNLETLHAKFRNPTIVEMFGSPQIQGEGFNHPLPYWEQACKNAVENPIQVAGNGNCGARRIKNLENDNFSNAFLSSVNRSYSYIVWYAYYANGSLNSSNASYSNRCFPTYAIVKSN